MGSGKLFYRSTTSVLSQVIYLFFLLVPVEAHGTMKTSHDFQYKFRLEPFFLTEKLCVWELLQGGLIMLKVSKWFKVKHNKETGSGDLFDFFY